MSNTNLSHLAQLIRAGRKILLVGSPGCAKTARLSAAAKEISYDFFSFRTSLLERPDINGCFVPDLKAGVTRLMPLELMNKLRKTDRPTVLLYDDLGQAPMDVQASVMSTFDDGYFPKHVITCGATNRPGEKSGVTALCEPLRSRFHKAYQIATPGVEDKPDGGVVLQPWCGDMTTGQPSEVLDWCNWAWDTYGEHATMPVAWHRSTSGRTLYQWKPNVDPSVRMADFRSWEVVLQDHADGLINFRDTAATLGKPVAAEYLAFARLADELPTPDQVFFAPDIAPVPKDPAPLYLITAMLANAVTPKQVPQLLTYLRRLPRIYGALLGRDTYAKIGSKLTGSREWQAWYTENQELFGGTAD